jgi:hypothetical protein
MIKVNIIIFIIKTINIFSKKKMLKLICFTIICCFISINSLNASDARKRSIISKNKKIEQTTLDYITKEVYPKIELDADTGKYETEIKRKDLEKVQGLDLNIFKLILKKDNYDIQFSKGSNNEDTLIISWDE